MAEFDHEEEIDWQVDLEPAGVMTGGRNGKRYLYYQLQNSIRHAAQIDIIVSFLMETGVEMILEDLRAALRRGARVRLLTGNYLGITQPSALYLIKRELKNQVDLRFYNEPGRAFHPKSYIFHYENGSEIYIGSSNLSKSALTSGIEWNYRFNSERDGESFRLFYETFEDLFYNHSVAVDDGELSRYAKGWRRPSVYRDLEQYDGKGGAEEKAVPLFRPRGAQIEALYALENSRAEGAVRGLVHAATGVGKTYLAAFDSAGFKRVLFVAHRDEILSQAFAAFKNVRGKETMGYFDAKHKDREGQVIFASVGTLGKEEYLTSRWFAPDAFDYIVIDEFHHAVNDQYRRIVSYFKPRFLLGLTATPERLDGKNIYELCDYNVPYEISLETAINRGILAPFHYYGIYDGTDYSGLRPVRGKYREEDLEAVYRGNKQRNELIYKYYRKYRSLRALGFCCSRAHAEEMAAEFNRRGVPAAAVYSGGQGEFSMERAKALEGLISGRLRIIFSVDMFNEGVDIASLDMVLFLRPTQSPVVFLQQLGRGLRRCRGKEFVNVLDFIGNYERAGLAPALLKGGAFGAEGEKKSGGEAACPEGCLVDFDMRLIDLFEEMQEKGLSFREKVKQEYFRVKDLIGRAPTRVELFTYMDGALYEACLRRPKDNPFRGYFEFLFGLGELDREGLKLYDSLGREFLQVLETTNMQKVYKMPVLKSFYNGGRVKMAVTDKELLAAWKEFFDHGSNWKDLGNGMTLERYRTLTDREHLENIKRNPVRFLKASGKGFFVDRDSFAIALRPELEETAGMAVFGEQMGDIIEYRAIEYYRRRYEAARGGTSVPEGEADGKNSRI